MCAHHVVVKRSARVDEETAAGKAGKRGRKVESLSGLSLALPLSLPLSVPFSNTVTHRSRFVIIRVKAAVCVRDPCSYYVTIGSWRVARSFQSFCTWASTDTMLRRRWSGTTMCFFVLRNRHWSNIACCARSPLSASMARIHGNLTQTDQTDGPGAKLIGEAFVCRGLSSVLQ
jgi:hypothetical protein